MCVCEPHCRWLKCRWFFSTPSKLVDHDIRQNVCIRFFFPFLLCRAKCKHKKKWFQFLPTLLWIAYLTFSGPFDINNKCFCLRCLVKWNEQQKIKFIRNWISGWKIGRFGIWPRRGIQSNSPRKRINNADRALTKQIIWEIPLFFSSYVKSEFLLLNSKKEMLNC